MKRLAIVFVLLSFPALAQAPQKIYKLDLSEQTLNVIAGALAKQPYGEVVATISEIQRQIAAQQHPPPTADPEKTEKK